MVNIADIHRYWSSLSDAEKATQVEQHEAKLRELICEVVHAMRHRGPPADVLAMLDPKPPADAFAVLDAKPPVDVPAMLDPKPSADVFAMFDPKPPADVLAMLSKLDLACDQHITSTSDAIASLALAAYDSNMLGHLTAQSDFASFVAGQYISAGALSNVGDSATVLDGVLKDSFKPQLEEWRRIETSVRNFYAQIDECDDIGDLLRIVSDMDLHKDPALMRKIIVELVLAASEASDDLGDARQRTELLADELTRYQTKLLRVVDGHKLRQDANDKRVFVDRLLAEPTIVLEYIGDIRDFCAIRKLAAGEYGDKTLKGWYQEVRPDAPLKTGRPPSKRGAR